MQPFAINRLSFSFCVSIAFSSAAPRHSFCVSFLPPSSSIDTLSPSVCRLSLFQLPLRPDTSSPSVCRTHVFNFASSFFRQRQPCLSCRLIPLSSPSVYRLRVSTSAAHSFPFINWDTAISVKVLVSSAFLRYSAFSSFPAPISHCSSETEVAVVFSLVTVL